MIDVTLVLVHGNPETDAVWDPLIDALGRKDVVRLSPPGFGAPLPLAFPATYIAYRDWLVDELQHIDEPVDLVGHDWGGLHVLNAVMHQPERVASCQDARVGLLVASCEGARLLTRAPALLVVRVRSWSANA